jgi:DNA-binding PadR family transcriptional regulator
MAVKREREFLPDTSYVVLGLLSFGRRLTGYELRRWAQDSIRFFWAVPAMSQIYRDLERLAAHGYVTAREEPAGERPRTTYGITGAGRRELRRWLDHAPVGEPTVHHPVALRLFLGHATTPSRLVEVLEEHRRHVDELLAELRAVTAGLGDDPTFEAPRRVARWGRTFYGAERRAVREALVRVEETPPPPAPAGPG